MGEKGSCKAHWRGSKVRHKTGWWSLFPSWSVARLVAGGTTPPLCYTNTQTQNTHVLPCVTFCTTLCSVQGKQVVGWAATTIILRPISPRTQDLQVP